MSLTCELPVSTASDKSGTANKNKNAVPLSIMKHDVKKKYTNFNLQSSFNSKTIIKNFVN